MKKVVYHGIWTILMFVCCIINAITIGRGGYFAIPILIFTLLLFIYHGYGLYIYSSKN